MPGGLPAVQRQHQSTLWKLRQLLLLRDGDGLLQRNMYQCEFGSEQLRCLRVRLRRIHTDLHPRTMWRRRLPAG
jgi:hypothetical protein